MGTRVRCNRFQFWGWGGDECVLWLSERSRSTKSKGQIVIQISLEMNKQEQAFALWLSEA
jgi:hypothetical protein